MKRLSRTAALLLAAISTSAAQSARGLEARAARAI